MDFLKFDPDLDFKLLLAVPLIPLFGYALQILLRKRMPWGDKLLTAGLFVSMSITVWMAAKAIWAGYHHQEFIHESVGEDFVFRWLFTESPQTAAVVAGILYDPLGASMLAVVGIVSFCVHLFSIGYMRGDKRYNIFFANLSLFTFAMFGLVLSDNILFLFIFWELMGLMSYLLIGHFAHDPDNPYFHRWATWASKKAFLTTRLGDVSLLFGILFFYQHFETFQFTELWRKSQEAVEANGGVFPAWMTWSGLLVFGGTVGKSAQFPLHIWLPDAMAGPTPVSAMIHAATMVAAGVFLLGRMYPCFSPEVLTVVTIVGAFTALFAATIGMTAFDLKAVLAWSTISQLGFMVAAVGLGGVVAGMFHMVTHGFFKGCLFLSAGSVIHGCHHEQDMRRMGGLRKLMPVTFACMLVSTCAIAGLPFFSGFYSKDLILAAGYEGMAAQFDGWKLFALICLAVGAMFTAFYMFRLIFVTFFGEYRGVIIEPGHDDHGSGEQHEEIVHAEDGGIAHGHGGPTPKESPLAVTVALSILAFFGLVGGHFWLADPGFLAFWKSHPWFTEVATLKSMYGAGVGEWIEGRLGITEAIQHAAHGKAVISSLIIAPLGILLAWFLYVKRRDLPAKITAKLGAVYETVRDKYYIDELANVTVIRLTLTLAAVQAWFDRNVVDGLVNLVGLSNKGLGFFAAAFDRIVIDGAVTALALASQAFGAVLRLLQTGRIQQYATFAVAGGLLAAAWLILA
ncbi:MAG: NADH-quinone oxidoreductase subunit L [Planctomycetota bacterium]|nr:NADH-quinone oxidoreductase subunit L [Planctomycetota bacterium]